MKALDLFCGGGGAARGLIAAGFDVVGIDIKNHRKSYPGLFIQGDALKPPVRLEDFDFVWASPPCQAFSAVTVCRGSRLKEHPNLIPATRTLLAGHPMTVIENVPKAPTRPDVVLSGSMFGLLVHRKRKFEVAGFAVPFVLDPTHGTKTVLHGDLASVVGHGTPYRQGTFAERKNTPTHKRVLARNRISGWRDAMGIPGGEMTRDEIAEAIPPAYAEFIGRAAIEQLVTA